MTGTSPTGAEVHGEELGRGASARSCSWWRALNRRIRADAFEDLDNAIERYLFHPPLDHLRRRPVPANRFERAIARMHGDGSAPLLPLMRTDWRPRFLEQRAASIDNLRSAVRRYLDDGSEPPDEGARRELVYALGDVLLWYVVPDDEYGASDGPEECTLQFRRREGCVDVTGYIHMMYFDNPSQRWDDSTGELMKGHRKACLARPFMAQLSCEGELVFRIAAASEEVTLCQRLSPTLVGDFVGPCAREIRL